MGKNGCTIIVRICFVNIHIIYVQHTSKMVVLRLQKAHNIAKDLNNEGTWSSYFGDDDGQVGVTARVVGDHGVDLLIQVERCTCISLQTPRLVILFQFTNKYLYKLTYNLYISIINLFGYQYYLGSQSINKLNWVPQTAEN